MKRILTLIVAIFYLCSYKKESTMNHCLAGHWYGEYETTVINNDTGANRRTGAMIELDFYADGTERIVTGALTDGSYSMNRVTYYFHE